MDIHKSINNWSLISIKHKYPSMDTYCLRISIAECPWMDIPVWISMLISTLLWIIEDWHKNNGYPCWYPWTFGNPCMDMLWILSDQGYQTALHCGWNVSIYCVPVFAAKPSRARWKSLNFIEVNLTNARLPPKIS